MRKLQTSDVFAALRIIKAANIREEIKPILAKAASEGIDVSDVGMDGMIALMEMIGDKKAEKAVYEFLSGPFEMSAEEVASMPVMELTASMEALAKDNDMQAFFAWVCGMIGRS